MRGGVVPWGTYRTTLGVPLTPSSYAMSPERTNPLSRRISRYDPLILTAPNETPFRIHPDTEWPILSTPTTNKGSSRRQARSPAAVTNPSLRSAQKSRGTDVKNSEVMPLDNLRSQRPRSSSAAPPKVLAFRTSSEKPKKQSPPSAQQDKTKGNKTRVVLDAESDWEETPGVDRLRLSASREDDDADDDEDDDEDDDNDDDDDSDGASDYGKGSETDNAGSGSGDSGSDVDQNEVTKPSKHRASSRSLKTPKKSKPVELAFTGRNNQVRGTSLQTRWSRSEGTKPPSSPPVLQDAPPSLGDIHFHRYGNAFTYWIWDQTDGTKVKHRGWVKAGLGCEHPTSKDHRLGQLSPITPPSWVSKKTLSSYWAKMEKNWPPIPLPTRYVPAPKP